MVVRENLETYAKEVSDFGVKGNRWQYHFSERLIYDRGLVQSTAPHAWAHYRCQWFGGFARPKERKTTPPRRDPRGMPAKNWNTEEEPRIIGSGFVLNRSARPPPADKPSHNNNPVPGFRLERDLVREVHRCALTPSALTSLPLQEFGLSMPRFSQT